jgi:V8-like Glu-specific endopeptidase
MLLTALLAAGLCHGEAYAQAERPTDPTGTQAAGLLALRPSAGTGTIIADPNIMEGDLLALGEASGMYSEYEMGSASIAPENFIPFAVIGADDRIVVTDTTAFPARAIVQILFESRPGSQHLCSGTMVSKDTVLTAAHCLHSGTKRGRPYQNFRVIPGRNLGAAPFGRCEGRQAMMLTGWTESDTPVESRDFDLGALKLDCDIGETTGWLGIRTLGDDELGLTTVVQGYASDRAPPARQWISKDQLRVLTALKGFYQNDTFGGTSGAGVTAEGADDVLIGVHTNGAHGSEEPWASHNAFARITPQWLQAVRNWIEQ